jgi:hypothetical protein
VVPARILIVALAALAWGCSPSSEVSTKDLADKTPVDQPAPQGNGGGIAPIGPNVGGITPVAGAENVGGGGGGGVGQAAKDMARSRASAASAVGSASQVQSALGGE